MGGESQEPDRLGPPSIHRCSAGANYGPERTKDGDGSVTTLLVLVILGLIWAAVLIPPYLQNRREHRPGDSIASFRHQLSVLERATPEGRMRQRPRPRSTSARYEASPTPPSRARPPRAACASRRRTSRRRAPGRAPASAAATSSSPCSAPCRVTFLLAVAMGGMVWMLHLAVDVAFVGYVGDAREAPAGVGREGPQGPLPRAGAAALVRAAAPPPRRQLNPAASSSRLRGGQR